MKRREFFRCLPVLPAAMIRLSSSDSFTELTIPCDLSMTALQLAFLEGERLGYGRPQMLIVGRELRWIARTLLGSAPLVVNYPEVNYFYQGLLGYEVRALKRAAWFVQFEHGRVGSDPDW